jgi:AraC-like DNA-binding protein
MLNDEFKERYTTIPFAIYQAKAIDGTQEVIAHFHREIELIAIIEGSAEFYINSEPYFVKKGDVLIVPPYAIHRGRTIGHELTSYDCICFDLQLLCDETLKKELESQKATVISLLTCDTPDVELLHSYITNAVLACKKSEIGWELEAIGNMSLMFAKLKKNKFIMQGFCGSRETEFGKKVMTYLLENATNHISSRDAAKELYINHSYFCRLFKKTFGCPFEKYVLIYRLEKARIYLTNTTLSVTDIAFCLGFRNCSYFNKTFKQRFNITPLSYRKNSCFSGSARRF